MADSAAGVAAGMYDQERQRMMSTLGMIPQVSQAEYADTAMLEDAGRAYDEDTMARFDWPYAKLDRFANTIYGSPAVGTANQTSRQPFDWTSAVIGGLKPLSGGVG
jgi:hypothetical protein